MTEMLARDEEPLMAQVKDGSIEAFEELYDRYCDRGLPGGTIDLSGRRARGGSARGNVNCRCSVQRAEWRDD